MSEKARQAVRQAIYHFDHAYESDCTNAWTRELVSSLHLAIKELEGRDELLKLLNGKDVEDE